MPVFVLQLESVLFVPIALQFIVSVFNLSISGMHNNACLFPGTTKKVQTFCYLLCSIFTLQCLIMLLLFGYTFLV